MSNSGVDKSFSCGSLGICGGKGSFPSWRFSEASGRLDFPSFRSTSRKGGGLQFHLWVGLLERPNCEPWQETIGKVWRYMSDGASIPRVPPVMREFTPVCQVVRCNKVFDGDGPGFIMRSCKAECRIFWNGLRIYCSFILLWVRLYCLDLFGFLSLHSLSLRPCQETHPGISVSRGKLWFAWSFAGNASSVDEKNSCASRQPVLKTWQCIQSWRLGFLVVLLNVSVTVWKPTIQHDSSSTKSMRWQRKNRAMLRHEPLQRFGCWSLQLQACNCDSNLCIFCCTQLFCPKHSF